MRGLRSFLVVAALLAIFLSAACRAPAPEPDLAGTAVVADLVAELPIAEVRRETAGIDFGTKEGRLHLVSGFYGDEGRQVWSRGPVSAVEFFLAAPRELRAEIRARPFRGFPRLTVTPRLNGVPLPPFTLTSAAEDVTLELPRARLRAGANLLEFTYSQVSEPQRATGHRRVAVAWDELRLRPSRPVAHEPRIESVAAAGEAPHALSLPLGSEAAYFLDLPAGSRVVFERVEASGAAAGLEVWLGGRRVATVAPSSRRSAVALPLAGEGWVQLGLRPAAASSRPAAGEIRLEKPGIWAAPQPPAARPAAHALAGKRPNVLVYLVDTLRADRLGCYGYGRPVSPHLDAFADGAVLFERAVAQSPWTRPSVASILTGMLPTAHGVQTLDDRLPEAARTLPEILHEAGYRTAALSTNHHVSTGTGLAQGFDDFFLDEEHHAEPVVRRAVAWLDRRPDRERPFFLYVHTLDPHAPYEPPAEQRRRFAPEVRPGAGSRAGLDRLYRARGAEKTALIAEVSRLYDAEVAAGDEAFGHLLAALRERGLYDDTLIVFVSDHGEELGERGGLGHGYSLYQEVLSIPLVVKPAGPPGQPAGRRSSHLAQHVDLLPTILAAAGLALPPDLPGTDLLAPLPPGVRQRIALSHLRYGDAFGMSATTVPWKLIVPWSRKLGEGPELYDLAADPGETRNLKRGHPVPAGYLATRIRAEERRGRGVTPDRAVLGEEEKKALQALGY